jgi:hypothetical protein
MLPRLSPALIPHMHGLCRLRGRVPPSEPFARSMAEVEVALGIRGELQVLLLHRALPVDRRVVRAHRLGHEGHLDVQSRRHAVRPE